MSDMLNAILARPWATTAVLMILGTILVVVGLGTPGAALFGLAGMLIMYLSGQDTTAK